MSDIALDWKGTPRTCFFVPAALHIRYEIFTIESVFVPHHTQGSEAPVDSVHSKVGREMISKLIAALVIYMSG